jgi:Tfp pilus assembly protein PilN
MIRTNLSTRPFYNERAVMLVLAIAAALVLVLTVFNVTRLVALSRRQATIGAMADQSERSARDLREKAGAARASVDQKRLAAIASATHEANGLIDRRVFSWTELFNRFEATLPAGVRISAVRPSVDQEGHVIMTIAVVARSVDDVDAFIEALEGTEAFGDLLSREERFNDEGLLEATLRGVYQPGRGTDAPSEPLSSDSASPEARQ